MVVRPTRFGKNNPRPQIKGTSKEQIQLGLSNFNFSRFKSAQKVGTGSNRFTNQLRLNTQGVSQKEISEIFRKEDVNRRISQRRGAGISATAIRQASQRKVIPKVIPTTSKVSKFISGFAKPPKPFTVQQEKLQGFQGGVGTVGKVKTSAFNIIGGKAIPKGAEKSGFATTKPFITGNKEIDRIFAQQRGVTQLVTANFVKQRNLALAGGATISEAQKFAEVTSKGLPKQEQEAINIILQKDIIQTRASQLDLAETLIKKQVTGEIPAGGLDDLAEQLKFAQPIPITTIRIGLDSTGKDISPRKTKLQIENAILTGSSLKDLDFNVQVDKNLVLSSKSPDDIFTTDTFGNIIIDVNKFSSVINRNAIKQIETGDNDIFGSILKDITESSVQPELINKIKSEGGILTPEQIQDITLEGEILKDTDIVVGLQNKLIELIQSGDIDLISDEETGIITLITKSGEEIFRGTPEEVINFIDKQLEQSGIQNEELLAIIANLRAQLRGGSNLNEILSALFSIFAELQRLGLQQEKLQGELQVQENPFDDFFGFFENIYLNFISFFGVK